jgi:cell division protein FtsW
MIILCVFGMLMVFSASSATCAASEVYNYDAFYLLKKQALFAGIGVVALFISRSVPMKMLYYKLYGVCYVAAIFVILLLLTPLRYGSHGAYRWLKFGSFTLQVADVVKLLLIIFLAGYIERNAHKLSNRWEIAKIWILGGIPAAMLFKISNDLSSCIVVFGITFGLTFIYSKDVKWHVGLGIVAVVAVVMIYFHYSANLPTPDELSQMSFRKQRILAWVAPELYASDKSFQTMQSLYAIGSGGLFGKGLGNGIQKLGNIPEAQNDMIFAIICEEMGIVGACFLIYLYAYMGYQMAKLAINCKDIFSSAVVSGALLHISIQVFINIGVCLNLIPNTGIGLPFISYGGSAIFLLLAEMGVVFCMSRNISDKPEVV